jgi:hypothetical protein
MLGAGCVIGESQPAIPTLQAAWAICACGWHMALSQWDTAGTGHDGAGVR